MSVTDRAIEAVDLVKTYGRGKREVRALAGVTFAVRPGIIFALLGPNGAGKSTTVKILTTLSVPDSGSATVAGIDVRHDPGRIRRVIGYVSQRPTFDPAATGLENLVLQGRIHGASAAQARVRARELLARFDLTAAAGRTAGTWSGGMQRKLDVAMGLMHRPRVLFLDEPTTGLDPEARMGMWAEIGRLAREDGLTVLLTTHYLDEADHLAARLAIVDAGRVVASGTPDELKGALGGETVRVSLPAAPEAERARHVLERLPGIAAVESDGTVVNARVANGAAALPGLLAALEAATVELTTVTVARPSLDDVYLHHAGRSFSSASLEGADR
ncbi:ATP-binding cassette domain-containing protein [Couchioplanes caeruleus]|uniref:ABC transporter ATP-binding protein n=1 Tax=Couchioplanes caeruleus TaxID=56438 RepID=UPI00201C47B9|nr:ATP-binding cassette domain-containing protein [Couchioplanes caeruleus]UQU66655.1 ATP-binding cassette domain-containing protein [Couchioplanes caeruleus]